jgi:Asp-tRNA(Asn)/Glu-tRNA(Gln) amidotransferase A subunit family amidase
MSSTVIRARKLSPVELTAALLARIAALDDVYHAYITVTAEIALAQAKAAEAEIMAGTCRARSADLGRSVVRRHGARSTLRRRTRRA